MSLKYHRVVARIKGNNVCQVYNINHQQNYAIKFSIQAEETHYSGMLGKKIKLASVFSWRRWIPVVNQAVHKQS